MAHTHATKSFQPLSIAVMTVSDTRTEADDNTGKLLVERLTGADHRLAEKAIVPDDIDKMRATASRWIADESVQAIITTGGTGLTGRDSTPEAMRALFDKSIDGFGELFRWLSWEEIGTSTIQSRALAGLANGTPIFCLPGSSGACATGWDRIISHQLDAGYRPCNLVELMPRFRE